MINQILDLSKIEAGRVEVHLEAVEIATLVQDVASQFEPQARERDLTVTAVLPEDLALVKTDPEKLRQILINLVGNALKFTERGSVTLAVTAQRDGAIDTIEVRDTGIGIPSDRLGAVFEPFEQAEESTTRRFGGTGLGLSISRSLARLLGLELSVDSVLGEGTVFTLLFPTEPALLTPVANVTDDGDDSVSCQSGEVTLRDRLILVIDDDPDARTLMAQFLDDSGCCVIAATNGEQGLRMANTFSPDAIILDLRMPGIDGWEVLRRLQSDPALQRTPTVVVSVVAHEARTGGTQYDSVHSHNDTIGAMVLIEKPCTREDLSNALVHVLQGESQTAA